MKGTQQLILQMDRWNIKGKLSCNCKNIGYLNHTAFLAKNNAGTLYLSNISSAALWQEKKYYLSSSSHEE